MSQPREPRDDFIEFAQVWGGIADTYLEGVIMYDSRNGRFKDQVGYMIEEGELNGNKALKFITTTGATLTIQRKKGREVGRYTVVQGSRKTITATRAYLPTD